MSQVTFFVSPVCPPTGEEIYISNSLKSRPPPPQQFISILGYFVKVGFDVFLGTWFGKGAVGVIVCVLFLGGAGGVSLAAKDSQRLFFRYL